MDSKQDNYVARRFETPDRFSPFISRYDLEGSELQDLVQRNPDVVYSETFSLVTAQAFNDPKILVVPGRAVVIYGINTSSGAAYDPVANTGIEPVAGAAFVFSRMNSTDLRRGTALKHNRGFVGSFERLYLSWPPQANTACRIVIFRWDGVPWYNGEAAT